MADKVALGQVYLQVLQFPVNNIPPELHILVYHLRYGPLVAAVQRQSHHIDINNNKVIG
jgi:hypothetical protein